MAFRLIFFFNNSLKIASDLNVFCVSLSTTHHPLLLSLNLSPQYPFLPVCSGGVVGGGWGLEGERIGEGEGPSGIH